MTNSAEGNFSDLRLDLRVTEGLKKKINESWRIKLENSEIKSEGKSVPGAHPLAKRRGIIHQKSRVMSVNGGVKRQSPND